VKLTRKFVWGGLAVACAGLALAAQAAAWTPLFNGHNIDGWKVAGTDSWTVNNGAILAESTSGKYGYLMTTRDYKNFDLKLEFDAETLGNSGVFFHSRITGENPKTGPDIVGVQAEIDPSRHTGGLYETGGHGWVALPTAAGEKAIKPLGQWNSLEVLVDGDHIVTHLNGVQIVDYHYDPAKYTDGEIGLQIHTGEHDARIRFRNLEIQELP